MTKQEISFYDKPQVDALLDEKANVADLATVATTGSYDDLTDKPTIPAAQVNADWNATEGVAEILNKPTIPVAQVNADWNAVSGLAEILNKPSLDFVPFTPEGQSWGSGITKAYINQNGRASAMWISRSLAQYSIPVRSAGPYYNFQVGEPETQYDCINKGYLETALAGVVGTITVTDNTDYITITY